MPETDPYDFTDEFSRESSRRKKKAPVRNEFGEALYADESNFLDKVSTAFRRKVPEAYRTVLPGVSDVEDAAFLRDAVKSRRPGQIALGAAAFALPVVGSKLLKKGSKAIAKKVNNESTLASNFVDLNKLKKARVYQNELDAATHSPGMAREQQNVSEWLQSDGARKRFDALYGSEKAGDMMQRYFNRNVKTASPLESIPDINNKDHFAFYNPGSHDVVQTIPDTYPSSLIPSLGRHEYMHAATKGSEGISDSFNNAVKNLVPTQESVIDNSVKRASDFWEETGQEFSEERIKKVKQDAKKRAKYLLDPSEVYARVHELRTINGRGPSHIFKTSDLEDSLNEFSNLGKGRGSNIAELVDLVGKDNMVKLMNTLPAAGAATYIGGKAVVNPQDNTQQFAQGGEVMAKKKIQKYPKGGVVKMATGGDVPSMHDTTEAKWTDWFSGSYSPENGFQTQAQQGRDLVNDHLDTLSPEDQMSFYDESRAQLERDTNTLSSLPILGGLFGSIGQNKIDKLDAETADYRAEFSKMQGVRDSQQAMGVAPLDTAYKPTFQKGGEVQTQLIEIESGEPFRDSNGIASIRKDQALEHDSPGGGPVLAMEVGAEILGDNKDPVTGNKFKDMGRKLAGQNKKFGDMIADNKVSTTTNAAKAMQSKINKKWDALVDPARNKSFREPKQQQGIPKARYGLKVPGATNTQLQDYGYQGFGSSTPGYQGFATGSPGFDASKYQAPQVRQATGQEFRSGATGINMSQQPGALGQFYQDQGQWQGLLGSAAQLAPAAYNLIQGVSKPDYLNASDFYNPQYNKAISLMANRRHRIGSELEANRTANAIGRYNLRNSGASAGQQFSGEQALVANRLRNDARTYQGKQNIDNQYRGDEAGFRFGAGQGRASTNLRIADMNLRADAARKNHLGAALTQGSQFVQRNQLMANQSTHDQQLIQILRSQYPEFYNKWFSGVDFGNLG